MILFVKDLIFNLTTRMSAIIKSVPEKFFNFRTLKLMTAGYVVGTISSATLGMYREYQNTGKVDRKFSFKYHRAYDLRDHEIKSEFGAEE